MIRTVLKAIRIHFLKLGLSQPLSDLFFIDFLTQIQYYLVIICPLVLLPYHTIDDFLNQGTLLSPELE
jgi:hypothetical protein